MRVWAVAVLSVLSVTALGRDPVFAQSFEIRDGQTAGPQTMNGEGDTGAVQTGGAIEADDSDAVQMFNADQYLINDGEIWALYCTSGDPPCASVNSRGNGNVIINNGLFVANGLSAAGVIVEGSNTYLENNGSIGGFGNAGTSAGFGIAASGNNLTISNSGLIVAEGLAADGIVWSGTGLRINNSGSIVVTGDVSGGIVAAGDDVVIDNAGTVDVWGDATSVGIDLDGSGATVNNSGRIFSNQGPALYFHGSSATLNLLAGTAIQGPIVFSGGGNTATFGRGLSAAMTFSGSGVPGTILTGGRPFVTSGNTVAVTDITGFTSTGAMIEDLTGGIAGTIDTRLAELRAGGTHATAHTGFRAWLSPFAIGRTQGAHSASAGFSDALGGMIGGIETNVEADILAGAFVGVAGGQTEVDHGAQHINHSSVFGGGYLGYDSGVRFADLSLTIGTLAEGSRRRVANNLVLGGVEIARADYDGTFVSPSLTLGTRMPYGTATLEPSLRLRYAGLFLDDYTETGSDGAMSVAGRDIHVFSARGQMALAQAPVVTSAGIWQTTWRAGVDGVVENADDVSATLLGQDISFDATDRKTAVRGFIGANLALLSGNGMAFGGDVELAYGSDDAVIARAGAHFDIAF